MKKNFKKLFSWLAIVTIVASQTPLGSLLGTVGTASAEITSITVTAPNGGETLRGTGTITWSEFGSDQESSAVNIYYSSNGGSTYQGIIATNITGGTLSYDWNTTAVSDGSNYKIKVRIAGGSDYPQDDSDENFTIDNTAPVLSFTNDVATGPVTYDTISANWGNATIALWTYDADGTCPTSSEEYDYDDMYDMSQANEDNNGKYICLYGEDAIGNYTTLASANDINVDATIPYVPNTTLTSPNGGEYLSGGSTHIITWNSGAIVDTGGLGATPITLRYTINGGSSRVEIATNEANDGEYEWTVPNANTAVAFAVVIVTDAAGNGDANNAYDTSASTFTIDSTKPVVSTGYVTPNPGSGTVNVVVVFTETLSDIDAYIAPYVYVDDGSYHEVAPLVDGFHTNGWDTETNTWYGTISVAGLTDGSATLVVTGATDAAGNVMNDNTNAGTFSIDEEGPTYTINDGTAAGPVKNDTINVTLNDSNGVSSATYGFSSDSTCNGSDTYETSFSSATNFTIAGDHTDYLCIRAIDLVGNTSYTGGFLLNTDNTAPTAPVVSTGVTTPSTGTTPTIGIITTELSGTIRIYSGEDLFSTISPINSGADTIPFDSDPLVEGVHSEFSITFIDYAGNESSATSVDSFTIDLTNPIVQSVNPSFIDIDDFYTNDTTPTFTGYVTDNLTNIVSVEYSLDDGTTWTGVTAADGSFNSTGEGYTITTDPLEEGDQYMAIRTTDEVGHISTTTTYEFYVDTHIPTVTFNIPTDATTTMNIAGNAINTGASAINEVEYFIDTVCKGEGGDGTALTLSNGSEPLYAFSSKNFNGSINLSGIANGPHILYVHAKNEAGTRGLTVYDSFNVNSEAPDITSLYMSDVAGDTATINWTSDVTPDTAEYRIKLNNGQFGSWNELNAPHDLATLNVNKTYIIEIRLGIGDNYTTDTITFTTAGATDGIIVDSLTRILNGSTPTAGGGYASGYHYRFNLTINDILMDTLNFKLADWSNSATTMAVANNTKIFVSTNGIDDADYEPLSPAIDSTTLTSSNVYSSDLTIDGIDANSSKGGNQVTLDMFYKIPTGAQGIFSTSYGVRVSNTGD